MIPNIYKTIAVVTAAIFLAPIISFAEPSVSDAGNAGVIISVPTITAQGNAAVISPVNVPTITNQGNGAVVLTPSTPAITNQGNGASTGNPSTPTVTDQGNGASTGNPSTPIVTNQGNAATVDHSGGGTPSGDGTGTHGGNGGNTTSNTGGGSGFGFGGSSTGGSTGLPSTSNLGSCEYISSYLKMGADNDATEVTKLQTFLKNVEGLNVDINGTFDQKTFDAVEAFQTKYIDEIMTPWGVTTPTGQVYLTTKNKVNEVYCKSTFALTAEQLSEIEAYRKGITNGTIQIGSDGSLINSTTTASTTQEVGKTNSSSTSQAAAAVTSFVGKVWTKTWTFVKWLFGYK